MNLSVIILTKRDNGGVECMREEQAPANVKEQCERSAGRPPYFTKKKTFLYFGLKCKQ